MPIGLGFQRKHRKLGYKVKYFSYLFRRRKILQKRKSFGNNNCDSTIYVVKPDYEDGVEGLLSLIFRQLVYINYAYGKGYIPYVDWKHYKTQYYDGVNNVWEFFFKQPSGLQEQEVYSSKKVYLSGWTFKDINPRGFFSAKVFFDKELKQECSEIFEKYLRISDEVNSIVENESANLEISECMGVYVRGTDYVRLKPTGEYIQPTVEQVVPKIKEFISKYEGATIFLVTEDGDIYDFLKKEFGSLIKTVSFDSFVRGYQGSQVLSKSNVLDEDKKRRGQYYLAKMVLLSRCKYLISSITQGSKFSYVLNKGKYKDEYIFDMGLYK